MAAPSSDKVLLGAGLALVLLSAAAFGTLAWRHSGGPEGPPPRIELAAATYTPTAPEAPPIKTDTWAAPVSQRRGREWIYDTFTPPEIFYNARSRQFTVKPPASLLDEEQQEEFGLELIAVRPEPFRLQLIGYVGGDGNWRGTFQNLVSGEVFLGAAGRRVPNLGLVIKSLDVRTQSIKSGESMASNQRVATAVVHDEKARRDITLTHRERHFTGTLFALVAAPGENAAREVRMGDSFNLGEATYRIDKVTTTPPAIEVTKEAPTLTQPDVKVLAPREAEPVESPDGEKGGA